MMVLGSLFLALVSVSHVMGNVVVQVQQVVNGHDGSDSGCGKTGKDCQVKRTTAVPTSCMVLDIDQVLISSSSLTMFYVTNKMTLSEAIAECGKLEADVIDGAFFLDTLSEGATESCETSECEAEPKTGVPTTTIDTSCMILDIDQVLISPSSFKMFYVTNKMTLSEAKALCGNLAVDVIGGAFFLDSLNGGATKSCVTSGANDDILSIGANLEDIFYLTTKMSLLEAKTECLKHNMKVLDDEKLLDDTAVNIILDCGFSDLVWFDGIPPTSRKLYVASGKDSTDGSLLNAFDRLYQDANTKHLYNACCVKN